MKILHDLLGSLMTLDSDAGDAAKCGSELADKVELANEGK